MKLSSFVGLVCVGLFAVVGELGCSKAEAPPPSEPAAAVQPVSAPPPQPAPGLANREFGFEFQEGAPLLVGVAATLTFTDKNMAARAGCNTMSGDYQHSNGVLEVAGLATTKMGCPAPGHERDAWLSQFLTSKPQVKLAGPRLTLRSGSVRLVFAESGTPQ